MSVAPRLAVLTLAVVAATLGGACDSGKRDPGPDLLDQVDVEPEITINVDEQGFQPNTLTVQVGEAFEIANTGEKAHRFLIEEPYVDTGLLLSGESSVIVLTTTGTVTADDSENPGATLNIEVTPEG